MRTQAWKIQRVENDEIERDEIEYLLASLCLDEEDEDETSEMEEGGLSKSGKELLGRTGGLDDSDAEMEDDTSPVLAPKQKDAPKEEPVDNSPLKPASSGSARGTPTTSKSKGKRKTNSDDAKSSNNGATPKKVKTKKKQEVKPSKEETVPTSKSSAPAKVTPPSSSKAPSSSSSGPFTEDEIRAVLMQETPVTTHDFIAKFKSRLMRKEDKYAFAAILRRISKIQKTNGPNYVVLRDK